MVEFPANPMTDAAVGVRAGPQDSTAGFDCADALQRDNGGVSCLLALEAVASVYEETLDQRKNVDLTR